MHRWSPGDSIAWRLSIRIAPSREEHLSYVAPLVVVQDDPGEIAVLRRPGAINKRRNAIFDARHKRLVTDWRSGWSDEPWHTFRVLLLRRPEDGHSISLFWSETDDIFQFWYIDLVSGLRRTRTGFDYAENGLDVVVQPDLSTWRWKDDDELAFNVERGLYSQEEADELHREGERAVERLLREREHFERWISWRPDTSWSIPTLPDGWDRAP